MKITYTHTHSLIYIVIYKNRQAARRSGRRAETIKMAPTERPCTAEWMPPGSATQTTQPPKPPKPSKTTQTTHSHTGHAKTSHRTTARHICLPRNSLWLSLIKIIRPFRRLQSSTCKKEQGEWKTHPNTKIQQNVGNMKGPHFVTVQSSASHVAVTPEKWALQFTFTHTYI